MIFFVDCLLCMEISNIRVGEHLWCLLWLEGLWMWFHARTMSSLTLTSIWRSITGWCSDLGVVFKWAVFLCYAKLLLHYKWLRIGVEWLHIEKVDPCVSLVYVAKCGRVIFSFKDHVAHVLCMYELESLRDLDIYGFKGSDFEWTCWILGFNSILFLH